MGEIAEDMIEGRMCSWCGVYFEQEHGYPVACHHCWESNKQAGGDAAGVQKATHKEL